MAAGKGGGTRALEVLQKPAWRRAEPPGDPAFQHPGYVPRLFAPAEGPLEPPPRAWGNPPNPAPVGSRTPASSAAGPRTLYRGLRLPAPKAGLQGPGPGEGSGAAPSQGRASWARSAGREPPLQRRLWLGAGSAGLRAAGRGGEREGRAGRGAPSLSPLHVAQPETGRAGETLIPLRLPLHASIHLHSCVHPFIHTFAFTQHLCLRPLSVQSAPTVCWRALGSSGGAPAQTGIPAPLLAAAPS